MFENFFTSLSLVEPSGVQGTKLQEHCMKIASPEPHLWQSNQWRRIVANGFMYEAFTGCTSVVQWMRNKVVVLPQISLDKIQFTQPRGGVRV